MICIDKYMNQLIDSLKLHFGERLVYVGLQGSYMRGEATENSDIDVMAVIDDLDLEDLKSYRRIVKTMDNADKSCGFICSKNDLAHWNTLEICHLLHTTKDYYGELCMLVPAYSDQDIRHYVKMSVNNLYHEICHRYIHGVENQYLHALPAMYKSVFYILQNLYYLKHNKFYINKNELLHEITGKDRDVLQRAIALSNGLEKQSEEHYQFLFTWCQETIQTL